MEKLIDSKLKVIIGGGNHYSQKALEEAKAAEAVIKEDYTRAIKNGHKYDSEYYYFTIDYLNFYISDLVHVNNS